MMLLVYIKRHYKKDVHDILCRFNAHVLKKVFTTAIPEDLNYVTLREPGKRNIPLVPALAVTEQLHFSLE